MSPHVIDLRTAASPDEVRDVVHRAVQALAEGKVVAFPTETVYVLAASALHESSVTKLSELAKAATAKSQSGTSDRMVLAVKSADEALDYVPDLCPMGQRLGRRCWPGPVTLVVDDHHPDSLLKQLTPAVQQVVAPAGRLSLRVPAHETIHEVLRLLAGPVVIANAPTGGATEAVTAQEVIESVGGHVQLVLDDGRSRFGQPSSVVHVDDNRYDVLRVGVVSPQTIHRLASVLVLFVCTGNTCRSPMAEGMFRRAVADRLGCRPEEVEDRGIIVTSAGIAAMNGGRASPEAVIVMREMGIDLERHESQPLTEALVRHADLILTMTRSHRQAVLSQWPDAVERTKLVSRLSADVADPVGGPAELYRRCATQVRGELDAWLDELGIGAADSANSAAASSNGDAANASKKNGSNSAKKG
ncbi:MAG TPA: Sua5/YciO/YrdC/YwlC family protein [Pirellulales bacterium]|jgi:protein-tyrosine phosphatase|nr:Sua5/YciO/YrdC/YwlC family protein [Pirellulales bacterium]